jgi:hypothetical protein
MGSGAGQQRIVAFPNHSISEKVNVDSLFPDCFFQLLDHLHQRS